MKAIIIICLQFVFVSTSHANDEIQIVDQTTHKVRLLKKINLIDDQFVYLTVRDEGHVLGQNFIVQLRASCNGESDDFTKLKVLDSFSVCNLKPESVKINRKSTAIAFLSKTANINKYYEDLADGKVDPKVDCNASIEIQKFSLKNICK